MFQPLARACARSIGESAAATLAQPHGANGHVAGVQIGGAANTRSGAAKSKLRLLSAAEGSTFKYDLGSEDREGNQDSTVSVFTRDSDGTLRHFYSAHPRMGDDIRERGIDLLTPAYNVLDLRPRGRGDWYASLDYGTKVKQDR